MPYFRCFSLLLPLCFANSTVAQAQGFWSHTVDKEFHFAVAHEAAKRSPKWDDDMENPPLSARKAISAATKLKNRLVQDSKQMRWEFESATLIPIAGNQWIWMIKYEAHP